MPVETLPFQRGTTYSAGTPTLTFIPGAPTDSTSGNHMLGNEYVDYDKLYGTGRETRLRVVRNTSGFPLIAGQAVLLDVTCTKILGATITDAQGPSGAVGTPGPVAILDDQLVGTVASNDICYVIVGGIFLGMNGGAANVATNIINAGDPINCCTYGGTSGATLAGRLKTRVLASSTGGLTEQEGVFAYALSGVASSGGSNNQFLCDMWRQVGG